MELRTLECEEGIFNCRIQDSSEFRTEFAWREHAHKDVEIVGSKAKRDQQAMNYKSDERKHLVSQRDDDEQQQQQTQRTT